MRTYQQSRLLELVDSAAREGRAYLVAPVEQADAVACREAGLLYLVAGAATLTTEGLRYIFDLNTNR